MELEGDLTRENVLNFLSSSVIYGNLGLFVGAGFSKAVMYDDFKAGALGWGELIELTCKELGIDITNITSLSQKCISYPELSTLICDRYADENDTSYEEAKSIFKYTVCKNTNWYPNKEQRAAFSEYLKLINPKWVITTNYDLVIESLLTGRCLSLGPKDYITSPKNVIPVYHLHGIRHNPESIIITQEDYVKLFRPNEYRQIKLALTIKESTTLILGYGLGDVNVLSAVDWSKNIYQESSVYPHEIVQVVRTNNPKSAPYRDKNNIIILETNEINEFLAKFTEVLESNIRVYDKQIEDINQLNVDLTDVNGKNVNKFISDQDLRLKLLWVLSNFEIHMVSQFIDFLSRCIDKTWEDSIPYNSFEPYNQNLSILLDIIVHIEFKKMPPALFEFIAYSLERVSPYIGRNKGQSYQANETWEINKRNIPSEMVNELFEYSRREGYIRLKSILKPIII